MSWFNIHVDDYGWTGRIRAVQRGNPLNISTFTTLKFIYLRPGSSIEVEKTPSFELDGSDGWLFYTHEEGFIDTVGWWTVYLRLAKTEVELTGGARLFEVLARGT